MTPVFEDVRVSRRNVYVSKSQASVRHHRRRRTFSPVGHTCMWWDGLLVPPPASMCRGMKHNGGGVAPPSSRVLSGRRGLITAVGLTGSHSVNHDLLVWSRHRSQRRLHWLNEYSFLCVLRRLCFYNLRPRRQWRQGSFTSDGFPARVTSLIVDLWIGQLM